MRLACLILFPGLLVGLFGCTGIAGASFGIAELLSCLSLAAFLVTAAFAFAVFLVGARELFLDMRA